MGEIKRITINGFKSIKSLVDFELGRLNVIVGANGSGKSNLMQLFEMLFAMSYGGFQKYVLENGESNSFCHNGQKITQEISIRLDCEKANANIAYELKLFPASYRLMIQERRIVDGKEIAFSAPAYESEIFARQNMGDFPWHVYHFYDTTRLADSRMSSIVEDCHYLRSMGENIASFLLHLKENFAWHYHDIVSTIQTALPFFEDFDLTTYQAGPETKVKLAWRQKGNDEVMLPWQFSDGSLRFICLATALCQPELPELIVLDEPELGLHPEAIDLLSDMIEASSSRTQLIVMTQSPQLLDHFSLKDIIVAKRKDGGSTYERLNEDDFKTWLEDYSVGELWQKNVIQGGSVHE